jgi:hypothetical protein
MQEKVFLDSGIPGFLMISLGTSCQKSKIALVCNTDSCVFKGIFDLNL